MRNKKLIFILFMATSLVICGCTKKQIPKPVVNNNNNAQQVNTNTNTHPPINEPNPAENSIEVDIWPDVSFKEEDYKDWKTYTNTKLGYSIKHPADWEINACDEGCSSKQVIINPPDAESFVSYISIAIDSRKLESIRRIYTDQKYVPSYEEKQIIFAGKEAFMFSIDYDRIIVISSKNIIYSISTGKDKNKQVQQSLASFKFIDDDSEVEGEIDMSDWLTYKNEEYGFEVMYPGGWNKEEDRLSVYGSNQALNTEFYDGGFLEWFIIDSSDMDEATSSIENNLLNSPNEELTLRDLQLKKGEIKFFENKAFKLTYKMSYGGAVAEDSLITEVLISHNNKIFKLASTTIGDDYEKYSKIADTIISSVKFLR